MASKALIIILALLSLVNFPPVDSGCHIIYRSSWYQKNFQEPHIKHNILDCYNITLNKEIQLKEKINQYQPRALIQVLSIQKSFIPHIYNNTFNGYEFSAKMVELANISINIIEPNVFTNWPGLEILELSYNKLTEINFNLPASIKILNISHNDISKIKEFPYYDIIKLDLSYNSIFNVEKLIRFNRLKYLDLSHNNLSSLPNISWQSGLNLDSLILSHNNLKTIPDGIESLIIKNLDISANNITAFKCNNVIEKINLSHNYFSKICEFSKELTEIDLSVNKITHIDEHTFKKLDKLIFLNLSSNYINSIYPGTFNDLVNLNVLDLSDNNIAELPVGLFYHLEKLETLFIAKNNIHNFEHGTFTGLYNLETLNISNNNIGNLDAIYSLKSLRELNIIDNNLHKLDIDQITKQLRHLSDIEFNMHDIACEELTVYFLQFKLTRITVLKGSAIHVENINGIPCHSDSEIKLKLEETDEQRIGYIANCLSSIGVALIVILVVFVFIIILTSITMYQVIIKQRNQTETDCNLHSTCSVKLLNENDSVS